MRLPRVMARTNRVITNRLTVPVARAAAPFGVVHHVGRRSGREYSTPVRVLVASDEHIVIPVVYGLASDWVRNVVAAGELTLTNRGRDIHVGDVGVVTDPDRVPGLRAGALGRALRLEGFVVGRPAEPST